MSSVDEARGVLCFKAAADFLLSAFDSAVAGELSVYEQACISRHRVFRAREQMLRSRMCDGITPGGMPLLTNVNELNLHISCYCDSV